MRILPLAVAVLWGVVSALWMPRGPLTATQALAAIALSAAVGWLAGRRRAPWLALPAFWLALELTRIGVSGPSVDAPHLSAFGLLSLITGRGVHALLTLLPMALGIALARGRLRRLGAATLAVLAVTAGWPAHTSDIPGGVAELARVGELGVLIRGHDTSRPVLLFVPGPPGGSETGAMRRRLAVLEQDFVVATLDRRGGGASYPALDGRSGLDRGIADIVAVADHLRERFGRARVHLLAHSGGSLLGALAAHRHPDRFAAYIGTGQAVHLPDVDRATHADVLAWARATGRAELAATLERQGPPPYRSVWEHEPLMLHQAEVYGGRAPGFDLDVPEYSPLQKAHILTGLLDAWSLQYPGLQDADLRRDVPSLEIPAYFVHGVDEMRGIEETFAPWYAALRAPRKRQVVLPDAGHRAMFEQPDRFRAVLRDLLA